MIIMNDNNHFAAPGTAEKLSTGPTVPIPGPTLLMQVAEAPIDDKKSIPIMLNTIDPKINVIK